jgi:prevent-host-death family protein
VATVSIRDLRNHSGDAVERVLAGESLVIARSGQPVAELRPVRSRGRDAATLLERWRHVPTVDPEALRRDMDEIVATSL